MSRTAINIDGPVGPRRADVFAGAAADTLLHNYFWNREAVFVGHHAHGLSRAMLCTRTARRFFGLNHAVVEFELDHTDLGYMLLLG